MADRPPAFSGQMPSSFDDDHEIRNERPLSKVARKIKEEPLVPLGIGLTVYAFINAYRALRRGDSRQANRMFRARVAAQGFTVLAMVAGSMYYGKDREKTKELRKLKEQHDAEEKRQKWIRELEVRDDEDKAMRTRLRQRRGGGEARRDDGGGDGPVAAGVDDRTEGTGGIIAKMGLWSKAEEQAGESKAAEEEARAVEQSEPVAEKRTRRENPKSSLGTIGDIVSSSNKRDFDSPQQTSEPRQDKPKD